MEKVIILGSGISGLTAAIYAARANLSPLVISGNEGGGQLLLTTEVENFPGFPDGIKANELVSNTKKQAERFGAIFKTDAANGFEAKDDCHEITLQSGEKVQARTLIIATGASAKWLGLDSEKEYKGKGVHSCATCDGYFYKDKELVVVGGGDSAMEESLFLTKFAKKVTIVHRRDQLRASKIMQEKFMKNLKTDIIWDSVIEEILGDNKKIKGVKLKNVKSEKITDFNCDGVFLAIGHIPNTTIFKGKLELDEHGYLKADQFMHTSVEGVFAAGDVYDTKYKQAITAAGTGCQAAIEAERYLIEKGYE